MRARVLIAAALLCATLVLAHLATSYVAMFYAAKELPRSLTRSRAPAPAPLAQAALSSTHGPAAAPPELEPEPVDSDSTQAAGERALHAATQRDPDIAALVNDSDPRVRGAILDFFEAPRSNRAPDR